VQFTPLKIKGNDMKKVIYALISLQTVLFSSFLSAEDITDVPLQRDQGLWQTFVMLGIAVLFFYVILWRPEQKRRKILEEQRSALKQGDRVVAMGIIGNVVRVQDQTVILKMFDGSKIEVLKAAITETLPASDEEAKKAEKENRN
jgi:preprotein translocase subunit YajC